MAMKTGALWLSILPVLTACAGQQISELEEEHNELRQEYDALEENVVALRTQMMDLGLVT